MPCVELACGQGAAPSRNGGIPAGLHSHTRAPIGVLWRCDGARDLVSGPGSPGNKLAARVVRAADQGSSMGRFIPHAALCWITVASDLAYTTYCQNFIFWSIPGLEGDTCRLRCWAMLYYSFLAMARKLVSHSHTDRTRVPSSV